MLYPDFVPLGRLFRDMLQADQVYQTRFADKQESNRKRIFLIKEGMRKVFN
jgi:hypothetical protein